MKTYFRNEIIIKKNTYINQIFKIVKGNVTNKNNTEHYKQNDYLFLDKIFYNNYTLDDYIAVDLVYGIWIDKNDIDMNYFKILSKMYQEKKNHAELLLINDSIIKVARYLFFEYKNNKTGSFYITFSMSELSVYLNISKKTLSSIITFFISKQVIAKHNKLFTILNITKLEKYAYCNDYI